MKTFHLLILILTLFSLNGCASAQNKKGKIVEKLQPKTAETKYKTNNKLMNKSASDNVRVLAEGAYSKIEQPFVFVARSNDTYAQLQNLAENLPSASEIDFSKTAVVAAFAGTKNTGGYAVSIKSAAGKVLIDTVNPPPGAMVAQVITAPFKVALVSLEETDSLILELSANWKNATQTYKITSGAFEYSGGYAGMQKKFAAEGAISIMSFGEYATLIFNINGRGAEKTRKLTGTISGWLQKGKVELARLDAGSFSENPKPPLKVSGTISGEKLSLVFEPLPTNVANGFQARGKVEAVKVR